MYDSGHGERRGVERPTREPSRLQDRTEAPLSKRLRLETRPDHEAVERSTGWPDSLVDVAAYRDCLTGLLAIWRPYEAALADWCDWEDFTTGPRLQRRAHLLERDLLLLGGDPAAVTDLLVDRPVTLPAFVGTLYVLEGSALGGRVIQAELSRRLGSDVAAATAFFSGDRAATTGARASVPWREVLINIDTFGAADADRPDAVVAGARKAFATFLDAFDARGSAVHS